VGFQKDHGEYYFVHKEIIETPQKLTKEQLGVSLVNWFESKND